MQWHTVPVPQFSGKLPLPPLTNQPARLRTRQKKRKKKNSTSLTRWAPEESPCYKHIQIVKRISFDSILVPLCSTDFSILANLFKVRLITEAVNLKFISQNINIISLGHEFKIYNHVYEKIINYFFSTHLRPGNNVFLIINSVRLMEVPLGTGADT